MLTSISINCFVNRKLLCESRQVADTEVHFFFCLIEADPDDNKFVDAYLAGQGDYLVTWDSHFNSLNSGEFPAVNVITPNEFLVILTNHLTNELLNEFPPLRR